MEILSPPHAIHEEKEYTLTDILGEGSFGKTYKCIHKITGDVFACKTIKKESPDSFNSKVSRYRVKREIAIMKRLSHPNIVTLIDSYQDPDMFYMVMEYCSGGTLEAQRMVKGRYTETEAAGIIRQIVLALKYCHERQVIHHDLTPYNIVFVAGETSTLKLIDFGLSTTFEAGTPLRQEHYCNEHYRAPELFRQQDYGPGVDIWSCGVILYELLYGTLPFTVDPNRARKRDIDLGIVVCKGIKDFTFPGLSVEVIELLKKMLLRNPDNRITAEAILEHPWIKE